MAERRIRAQKDKPTGVDTAQPDENLPSKRDAEAPVQDAREERWANGFVTSDGTRIPLFVPERDEEAA